MVKISIIALISAFACASAFVAPAVRVQNHALPSATSLWSTSESKEDNRRQFLAASTAAVLASVVTPEMASASGGATAGKYT